jgi:hypothetical protein
MDLTLQDVLYVPNLVLNLLSLTKYFSTKGVRLSSKGQFVTLQIQTIAMYFTKSLNMDLVSSLELKFTPIQITLQSLHRLWILSNFISCLEISCKALLPQFSTMDSILKNNCMRPVPTALYANSSKRISTKTTQTQPPNWVE